LLATAGVGRCRLFVSSSKGEIFCEKKEKKRKEKKRKEKKRKEMRKTINK
jgi:hypothetical protein